MERLSRWERLEQEVRTAMYLERIEVHDMLRTLRSPNPKYVESIRECVYNPPFLKPESEKKFEEFLKAQKGNRNTH
jgi:hypothetical protein